MAKTRYVEEWISQNEVIKKMEKTAFEETGVHLKFKLNIEDDIFLLNIEWQNLSITEMKKLVKAKWMAEYIVERVESLRFKTDKLISYMDKIIDQQKTFEFILGKTFGEGTKVYRKRWGKEELQLKVLIPLKYKLFKNTNLI